MYLVVLGNFALDFIYSQRGRPFLVIDKYLYRKNRGAYWRCIRCDTHKCKSRVILKHGQVPRVIEAHNHITETNKIQKSRDELAIIQ